jgi:hypothetical protein
MRREPEELRGISEAVLYELQMLFATAQALRDEIQGAEPQVMSWAQKMACIDSFAIRARVLEAFLWDSPRKAYPDDALAIDFLEDGEWETIRENVQRSALDHLRDRAGHEIAHLSYKRVERRRSARAGVSLNVKRRNLTAAQRAVAAAEAWDLVAVTGNRQRPKHKALAKIFGCSHDYVRQARALVERDPVAAEAVKRGELSLTPRKPQNAPFTAAATLCTARALAYPLPGEHGRAPGRVDGAGSAGARERRRRHSRHSRRRQRTPRGCAARDRHRQVAPGAHRDRRGTDVST